MAREIKLMNWKEVQETEAKYYYTVKLDCMYADTVGGSSNDEFQVGEDVIYRIGEGWYNGVVIDKTVYEDPYVRDMKREATSAYAYFTRKE